MSLRVWLPLNKDLRNQGLSGSLTFTNTSATLNSAGYYDFSGYTGNGINVGGNTWNTECTDFYNAYINNHSFSLSCWIKSSVATGTENPFIYLGYGVGLKQSGNGKPLIWLTGSNGDGGTINNGVVATTTLVNDGVWHHIVATYNVNDNAIKIYVDGVCEGTAYYPSGYKFVMNWKNTICIGRNPNGSEQTNAYFLQGSISDVRLYDHALSKKEVAELARGCVLHYPMNDILNESTVNLNGTYYQNWSAYTSYWTIIENTLNSIKLKASRTVDNNTVALTNSSLLSQLSINDIITISGYLYKGDVPHKASMNQTSTYTDSYQQISFKSRDDGYFESTVKVIGSGAWIFYAALFGSTTTNDICYIKNLQIEKKDHATVYTPSSRTQNLLKDISGFDNHSLITGSLPLVTTPKSPRYDKCMNIDNSGTNKNYANCTIAAPQVKSASFWVYIGSSLPSGSQIVFQDKPSHLAFGFHQGTGCITYAGTSAKPCRYVLTNIVKNNSWNHFVIIQLEDFTTELRLNCIKQLNPTNTYWGENYDGFCFGARNNQSNISGIFTGKISDFRLFSRVLTQADVDDLYKDSFAIDKSQNGYCYELNESDAQSSVDVKKNGQLKCKNYSEDFDALYLPAGTYVDILMDYAVGDTWKAETFIKYDANGSGRDLMGVSGNGSNYWGVTTDGTWELHGRGTYTNADITKYNKIVYTYTIESGELGGNYQVGALRASYTNRNKTIYHTRLWKNDVLERDLYPCSIGNQVGLIDGLTGTFYPVQKLSSTGADASLVSGIPEVRLGKTGVTMNEIYEI